MQETGTAQVPSSMETVIAELKSAIGVLDTVINELSDKLVGVLTSPSPDDGNRVVAEDVRPTFLATRLADVVGLVLEQGDRLRSILERLDL